MAVFLSPASLAGGPFFIPGGNTPAAGGLIFTYSSGSSTKLATYTTSSGAVANANPLVLDSGGNLTGSGEIWLIQTSSYRFILAPSNDTDPPSSPYWTRDSITGINDVQNATLVEWIASSTTPVFSNTNSFVVSGDQTQTFTLGRRTKTTNSGGTIYSTITSTAFTTSTAVGVANDSGSLDAGLSAVSYGVLSTPNGSIPWTKITSLGLDYSQASVSTGALSVTGSAAVTGSVTVTGSSQIIGSLTVSTSLTKLSNTSTGPLYASSLGLGVSSISGSIINLPYPSFIAAQDSTATTARVLIGIQTINSRVNVVMVGDRSGGVGDQTRGLQFGSAMSNTSEPTTSDITNGTWCLWRNASASTVKFYFNTGNALVSSAAFT